MKIIKVLNDDLNLKPPDYVSDVHQLLSEWVTIKILMEFKRIMPTFFPDSWAASYDVGTAVTQMVISFNNFCF